MSLRDLILGRASQEQSPAAFPGIFNPWEDITKKESLRLHREHNMNVLIHAATEYWQAQLQALADQHAAAISETMLGAMKLGEDVLKGKLAEQQRKIALAHGILLQHSDTRWSRSVTDEALENLQHTPHTFRKKARV
ncbi:hypothetical protein A8B75_01005 [Sphingomonadales bacterium EhC05]|nr:hypothetical protein A8B75_01005 [Sphingomonadales bacterium EhC05]